MAPENSFSDSDGRPINPRLDSGMTYPPATQITLPILSSTSGRGIKDIDTKVTQSEMPASPRSNVPRETVIVPGAASARFRNSVRKIMLMNRASAAISTLGAGAEPGIDPRRMSAQVNYGHIKQNCVIDIVDYSSVRSSFRQMENKGFLEYINDAQASKRERWVSVRWINVAGISWDVVSALALKYNLHPLATEDVLHQRPQGRSKLDYYSNHLFVHVLRHCLAAESDGTDPRDIILPTFPDHPRSSSPTAMRDEDWESGGENTNYESGGSKYSTRKKNRSASGRPLARKISFAMKKIDRGSSELSSRASTTNSMRARRELAVNALTIEELKKGRIHVKTSPMFMFLFRDGTVISIQASPDADFTAPIIARLRQRDSGLRATPDASLLLQSLIDLVVDKALEVVDEYHKEILMLEREILIKPKMKTVRRLHILSGDLTLHKRTLEPIKTMVYGLRRYDVDRSVALVETSTGDKTALDGFMSHKSKIYLADVHDHLEYILSSLDMFSSISENLISYTFNLTSYEMNSVMRILTQATIIFLPLTLLTGYFGMNFKHMWSVKNQAHTDVLYWIIALPVMAIIIPLFMWSDIVAIAHYIKKRWTMVQSAKTVKKTQ